MPGECGVGLDAPRVKENGAHCWFGVCHFFFFFFKFKFFILIFIYFVNLIYIYTYNR